MKKALTLATALLLTAGLGFGFPPQQKGKKGSQTQGQQMKKRDGTGPGAKLGKRTGPRDGSGPIHTPGTGGGNGGGRRGGRN